MSEDRCEHDITDPVNEECSGPCSPDAACDECTEYWNRMRVEGYWTDNKGWTNRGWREILKGAK